MKQLIRFIIFIILLGIVLGSRPLAFKSARQITGLGYTGYMASVTDHNTVSQTFISAEDNLSGVSVIAGVIDKDLEGTVNLEINEMLRKGGDRVVEGRQLVSVSKDVGNFSQYGQIFFWFPSVSVRSGSLLKLSISGNIKDNKAVTLWKSKKDIYKEGSIFDSSTENTAQKRGDLVFSVFSKKSLIDMSSSINAKALLPAPLILIFLMGSTMIAALIVYQFSKVFKK